MLTRRSFFGSAVAASSAVVAGRASGTQAGAATVKEAARDVPVAGSCDVLIAGGGPAGIAAAVTAARKGAKVVLLEMQGCLGGIWTSGMLSCLIGMNKSDLDREIKARLEKYGAIHVRRPKDNGFNVLYEPEYMKLVCEEMCIEAGIRIRLHTSVVGVVKDASGRKIEAVVTESKKGREAWLAKYFVDCTGDGDLGAISGCGFDVGGVNPGDPEQPASLIALLTIPDESGVSRYLTNDPSNFDQEGNRIVNAKLELLAALNKVGIAPSYGHPTMFRINKRLFAFMGNHEYDIPVDDADAITEATLRARREIFNMVDALATKGGGEWKGLRIVFSAERLWHRRARRLHGRYTLTLDDCFAGRKFPDGICTCSFGIDVHAVSKAMNKKIPAGSPIPRRIKPYQIPLRSCQSKDIDNLYMAGRCISGDFMPQSSYRITGTAIGMGVGVADAICKSLGCQPRI